MSARRMRGAFVGTIVLLLASALFPVAAWGQAPAPPVASVQIGPQVGGFGPLGITLITSVFANPVNHKVYVVGVDGTTQPNTNVIGVLDGTTNQPLTHFPAGTWVGLNLFNFGRQSLVLNKPKNQIYFISDSIQVIDSNTDTIVNTFSPSPGTHYLGGDYNPVTDRLYIYESVDLTPTTGEYHLVALDGSTGQQLALLSNPTFPMEIETALLINPATNKIYTFGTQFAALPSYTVYDGATNTVLASGRTVYPVEGFGGLTGGYFLSSFNINPADNSVLFPVDWHSHFSDPSLNGNISFTPPVLRFMRLDGATDQLTYSPQMYGEFTGIGFDRPSGRLIGFGGCFPVSTVLPTSSPNPCLEPGVVTSTLNWVAYDPAVPGQIIEMDAVAPDGFATSLGTDLDGGYYYQAVFNPASKTLPYNVQIFSLNFAGTASSAFLPHASNIVGTATLPSSLGFAPPDTFPITAIDSVTHRGYFLAGTNQIGVVDPTVPSLQFVTLPFADLPAGLAFNPTTNTVFVTDAANGMFTVMDGATRTARPEVNIGQGPFVAVNPSTNQLVVASTVSLATDPTQTTGAILVDAATETVIQTLPAAATTGVRVNPVTNIAYFANQTEWYAVDLSTGTRTFTGSDLSGTGTDTCQITGLDVNPLTNQIFVAGRCQTNGQTLAVFDGATNTLIKQVSHGALVPATALQPDLGFTQLAVNPKTNKVFVGNTAATELDVFDTDTLLFEQAFPNITIDPKASLAMDTASNFLYACWNDCSAIETRTGGVKRLVVNLNPAQGTGALAVAVDEANNLVYVTSKFDRFGLPGSFVNVYPGFVSNNIASGVVVDGPGPNAKGVPGITITASATNANGVTITVSTVTDENGLFFLATSPLGTVITASGGGVVFVPNSVSVQGAVNNGPIKFIATPPFNLSGQVVDATGAGMANVTVGVVGQTRQMTVTDATGAFSFSGLPGAPSGPVSVSVSEAGFYFTPTFHTVTISTADATGVNFVGHPNFTISGQVVDPAGVGIGLGFQMVLSGPVQRAVTADVNGLFSFSVPPGVYTISPNTFGSQTILFAPKFQTVTVTSADVTGVQFALVPTFTISGQVVDGGGLPLPGITMTSQGTHAVSVVTDALGNFQMLGFPAGTYTIVPTTPGLFYTPASASVTVASANIVGVNFTAVPSFVISGVVSQAPLANGTTPGAPGVTVVVAGAVGASAVTDANGHYAMSPLPGGNYTVSASAPGWALSAAQAVKIAKADLTVNFIATPTYSISGQVLSLSGTGLGGVTVSTAGASAVTNASGGYTLSGLLGSSAGTPYTITPQAPGLVFSPVSQVVTVTNANVTGVAFKVLPTLISSYTLSTSLVNSGVTITATVQLNQPVQTAATIALTASDPKAVKLPTSVTVPAGSSSVQFTLQSNGVSTTESVTLTATLQGLSGTTPSSGSTVLIDAPTDTLHVTLCTWSTSTQVLTVTATSTNSLATITVLNSSGNGFLGTMTNLGGGNYSFQMTIASISGVNIKSNLGGSTGQGITKVP